MTKRKFTGHIEIPYEIEIEEEIIQSIVENWDDEKHPPDHPDFQGKGWQDYYWPVYGAEDVVQHLVFNYHFNEIDVRIIDGFADREKDEVVFKSGGRNDHYIDVWEDT